MRHALLPCGCAAQGDVFVLDTGGSTIFQWNGREANRREKAKALEVAISIRDDDRSGRAQLVVIDDVPSGADARPGAELDEDEKAFWALLQGTRAEVRQAAHAGADEAIGSLQAAGANAPNAAAAPKLFRISDKRGSLAMVPASAPNAPLSRSLLDDSDAFLLDTNAGGGGGGMFGRGGTGGGGGGALFVWIGKQASKEERSGAVRLAEKYARSQGKPQGVQITRVASGGEPAAFRAHFSDWASAANQMPITDLASFQRAQGRTAAAEKGSSSDELAAQMAAPTARGGGGGAADGREDVPLPAPPPAGAVRVYRIERFERVELPAAEHGLLNGSDCYIVSYTEKGAGSERTFLYYWLGAHASADEKGAAAIQTVKLSDSLGGGCAQVRICQGHETPRFLSLFAPRLVVFAAGGVASGFRKVAFAADGDGAAGAAAGAEGSAHGGALLHVRGTCPQDVHAVQLEAARASSLSSYDCFIVQSPIAGPGASAGGVSLPKWMTGALSAAKGTPPTLWVWLGARANAAERDGATAAAELLRAATAAGLNPNVLGAKAAGSGSAGARAPGGDKAIAVADVKVVVVEEGSEPAAFWAALGGKAEYTSAPPTPTGAGKPPPPNGARGKGIFGWLGGAARGFGGNSAYNTSYSPDDARLFHVTDRTGTLKVRRLRVRVAAARAARCSRLPPPRLCSAVWLLASPAPTLSRPPSPSSPARPAQVEEILNFAQDDLDPDDVSILDAGAVLYVWVGPGASERERTHSPELAEKFAEKSAAASGRSANVPVMRIEAGREPAHFKALFHGWADEKATVTYDPYEEKLKAQNVRRARGSAAPRATAR